MIANLAELAENHGGKPAKTILSALDHTLEQLDPGNLLKQAVKVRRELRICGIKGEKVTIANIDNIYVVGAGKACGRMAESLCSVLGQRVTQGAITVPYGDIQTASGKLPQTLYVTEAAHPIPDEAGIRGSEKMVDLLGKAGPNDLVFVLISGGGSALLPLPAPGLTLSDKQKITGALLTSGATIQEINIIRKHLSAIKGGQLLKHTNNARVVSLILSDVVDDDVSSIASGPTCPDPSTFADALKILGKYRLAGSRNPAVRHIIKGSRGLIEDTPKPGDSLFKNVHNVLIGNNEIACRAAAGFLRRRRIRTAYLGSRFSGEASNFGRFLARFAGDLRNREQRQFAIVLGGETTVTIKGRAGMGGRNQESGLSCAMRLPSGILVACMGTDGIDGMSDAAGALVSKSTTANARRKKLDLTRYLKQHDSYTALKATNSLIFTGRTGTNVNDIAIIFSHG